MFYADYNWTKALSSHPFTAYPFVVKHVLTLFFTIQLLRAKPVYFFSAAFTVLPLGATPIFHASLLLHSRLKYSSLDHAEHFSTQSLQEIKCPRRPPKGILSVVIITPSNKHCPSTLTRQQLLTVQFEVMVEQQHFVLTGLRKKFVINEMKRKMQGKHTHTLLHTITYTAKT